MALFRGAVGPAPVANLLNTFDPLYTPPQVLSSVTRIDQGVTLSPALSTSKVLAEFSSASTFATSGLASFQTSYALSEHESPVSGNPARRFGLVTWNSPGANVYLESRWNPLDLSGYPVLEFDVDRPAGALNPVAPTNFHVQLLQANGSQSTSLSVNNYAVIDGPQAGPAGNAHAMLKTVRIPLTDFTGIDRTSVAGVRFTFDDTASGAIVLSTIAADAARVDPSVIMSVISVILEWA